MPKKQGEQRRDGFGVIKKMAEADGWVMVRRSGAIPYTMMLKEWNALAGIATAGGSEDAQGYIYFIDGGEHIKIGYSRSMVRRMQKIATDFPDGEKVLLVQPGTFQTEKVVHRHFAGSHHRGEWFRKTPELLDYIKQRKDL